MDGRKKTAAVLRRSLPVNRNLISTRVPQHMKPPWRNLPVLEATVNAPKRCPPLFWCTCLSTALRTCSGHIQRIVSVGCAKLIPGKQITANEDGFWFLQVGRPAECRFGLQCPHHCRKSRLRHNRCPTVPTSSHLETSTSAFTAIVSCVTVRLLGGSIKLRRNFSPF